MLLTKRGHKYPTTTSILRAITASTLRMKVGLNLCQPDWKTDSLSERECDCSADNYMLVHGLI